MKLFFALFAVFFGGSFLSAQGIETAIEKARFLIQQHQEQTNIPGVQVALMINDSLVWSEGFGYSNLNKNTPVDRTTTFRIASVSKSVTSVALGKMMDEEQIDIDKNISEYLPAFPVKEYPITGRQLAASTAGIRHYTDQDPEYNDVNYPNVVSSLERFRDDPLLFEPGTDHHYSSYGWVLLSAVMEKAADKPFEQIMQESWDDLGMEHTTFDDPDSAAKKSTQYIHDKKSGRVEAPQDNRSYMYAGGGYLSTAEDLVRMGKQLLQNDYLTESTRTELFSPTILPDGTNTHYGLGWESGINRSETPVVYHSGSMSSARSHLVLFPEKKIVFAYLANTGDQIFFNDREAHSIAELFLAEAPVRTDTTIISGEWEIVTTSLRDKKTSGTLKLNQNAAGITEGSITFKRSKKEKTFPVLLAGNELNQFHLVAVTPMFLDVYLTVEGNEAQGTWLHDFNVNGKPETDDYWKPRKIVAKKRTTFKNQNN